MNTAVKPCRCEHWQRCPMCRPQDYDFEGNLMPPPLTELEKAQAHIYRLQKQIGKDTVRIAVLEDALQRISHHTKEELCWAIARAALR